VVSKKTCEKNQKKKNKGKKKKNMLAIQRARIAARGAKRLASQFESDGKERVYVPGSVCNEKTTGSILCLFVLSFFVCRLETHFFFFSQS
jgi:hypothetical protein